MHKTALVIVLLISSIAFLNLSSGGQSEWTDVTPAAEPSPRHGHAMAYDADSDRVILFGGHGGLGGSHETWVHDFNNNTWTKMNPGTKPSRRGHAMAYDAESDRVILFGGKSGSQRLLDTWAYDFDTNTWTKMTPATGPSARCCHAMAYDAESDRVVLFGGLTGVGRNAETWAYDFNNNTWTKMTLVAEPAARQSHAMAYDAESDRVILFGGIMDLGNSNETWVYDFNNNTWTKMTPATGPSARCCHAMAYDAESDRVILFGGFFQEGPETWAYDFNANSWRNMSPAMQHTAWVGPKMAYDAESDRVILFGGIMDLGNSNETWVYDFNNNTWTAVTPPPDTTNPTISITSPAEGSNLASTSVTVSGTASDDVAVEEVELSTDGMTWVLATGTTSWSGTLTLAKGPNTISARATDTAGNTATVTIAVTVDTVKPIADAGEDQTANAGATVSFDASSSSDDVAIVSYAWDFGDGTTGTGQTTTHIYTDPGTYTVTLTVRDAAGNTDTDISIVTVEAPPGFQVSPSVATFAGIGAVAVATAVAALLLWRRARGKGKG